MTVIFLQLSIIPVIQNLYTIPIDDEIYLEIKYCRTAIQTFLGDFDSNIMYLFFISVSNLFSDVNQVRVGL